MTAGNFIKRGIMPLILMGILTWLGRYIYMGNGWVDWFRFILVYGIPVGIPYMFIIIPTRWSLSGTVGMAAFCVIVGALFGFVLAAAIVVRAVWYVTMFPLSCLVRHREGRNRI